MSVLFSSRGWADYFSWSGDHDMLRRINRLIAEASHNPARGIGKPRPLIGSLSDYWSRRITEEHHLIYRQRGMDLVIVQARHRY